MEDITKDQVPEPTGPPDEPQVPPPPPAAAVDDEEPVPRSSRFSCLYCISRSGGPTNYDMLLFRTLNRDLGRPNHNDDYLAIQLRDELMPFRSWCLRHLPWVKYQLRSGLENQLLGVPGCINFIDARTKWFDGAVHEATTAPGGVTQVVIIAAGFDTRAYRLAQPGVTFFEVDLPEASHRKRHLVDKLGIVTQESRAPVYAAADLSRVDLSAALSGTGFRPEIPTLFTIEGLIYYLPEAAAHRLMASVGQLAAPGSVVAFDFMHKAALATRGKGYPGWMITAKAVANKGEPYRFGIDSAPEAVQQFVGLHGFRLNKFLSPRDMVEQMLPHIEWSDNPPPIASFYSYAQVVKQ